MKYSNKIQDCIFESNIKTIFAVDIKKGEVVKAFAGLRFNYKKLILNRFDYSNPIKLIEKISTKFELKFVYIADLDSIVNLKPNTKIIIEILKQFPNITFYIDNGLSYCSSINTLQSLLIKNRTENFRLILGTETLRVHKFQNLRRYSNCLISIDFNGKEKQWLRRLSKNKTQFDLIFMFLKKVGGRGIDWKKCKDLIRLFPNNKCFFAGGVKTDRDLRHLQKIGFSGVVLSTMLHNKIRDE